MRSNPMNFTGKWVLVSGASSGLGHTLARQLAQKYRANIIAVARRKSHLEELKTELEPQFGVEVQPIGADLSNMNECDRVIQEATQGRELYAAILNAGVTHFGEHLDLEWDQFEKMLQLNVSSVVRMTRPLIDHFCKGNLQGGIMIVSSMAGIIPVPYQAAYSGTKAFLLNFGSALSEELQDRNVSITVYAPGGIQTEMTNTKSFQPLNRWLMPVEVAAKEAIEAFRRRKHIHIPGTGNQVGAFFAGLLPKKFLISKVGSTYRNALKQSK